MNSEITPQILSEWLAEMPLPQRARAINLIAYYLTICARDFEIAPKPLKNPELAIRMLIGISELQHQLLQQIGHYMDGEEVKVYPIDVFAAILFEKATAYQIVPFLKTAIHYVKRRSWPSSAKNQ